MKKLLLAIILLMSLTALFAGNSHPVYVELLVDGAHPASASFSAWVVGREAEVLTETSGGCTYYGSGAYAGSMVIQCATWPTSWAVGDVFHIEVTDNGVTEYVEYALNGAGYQFFGDMYGTYSEGPGVVINHNVGPDPVTIPNGETGAGDVVTPNNDTGTYVGDGYGRAALEADGYNDFTDLTFPDNIGVYTILTLDDGAPVSVTITLDGINYDPMHFAYFTNGHWHVTMNPTWNAHAVTFTVEFNTKANVNVPIVFSKSGGDPLPVELSSFFVKQQAQFAQISWTTQSESNMNGFQVKRATKEDYSDAVTVSELIGATNETVAHVYSYIDRNVVEGDTYYYQLEAINYDGTNAFFNLGSIKIEEPQAPQLPTVTELSANYPNPFNPETKISFKVKEGETATLSIYNQKGQIVSRNSYVAGNHEIVWDGTKQASGIYFYKLQSPTYSKIRKMIMLK